MSNGALSATASGFSKAIRPASVLVCASLMLSASGRADWPTFGRDNTRNPVSADKYGPMFWRPQLVDEMGQILQPALNVRWTADLGNHSMADPVVADGLVWIGTNNERINGGVLENDASVLLCFRERDGKLLYRYVSPRVPGDMFMDWPHASLACSPLVEGNRLWFTTNRCELICLNLEALKKGFSPSVLWSVDMRTELGVAQRGVPMGRCHTASVAGFKDYLYVITGNGVGEDSSTIPKPKAPGLVCFRKDTGKVVWQDNSSSEFLLDGEWSSPLVAEVGGRAQVIAAQGDGWVRSFDAHSGKLIWKFDMNFKSATYYSLGGRSQRNSIPATPVFFENRIYIAHGQQPEHGEGPGRLCCIDATREGDISSQLLLDASGKVAPQRRYEPANPARGEKIVANPNSGLVWEFTRGSNNVMDDQMHRTVSSVAIHKGLVIAPDVGGYVHCLDARTGTKYWTCDVKSALLSNPLIVGDRAYVGTEDGDVVSFGLSARPEQAMRKVGANYEPIARIEMGQPIHASPIMTNGVLYITTDHKLFAIQEESAEEAGKKAPGGFWPQYRGPDRSNASREQGLLRQWPAEGPPLLWKAKGVGEGVASVAVANGRIYTVGYRQGEEYAFALDERTGAQLWSAHLGPATPENPLMRWLNHRTLTVDDDRVYVVTVRGELHCLAATDGKQLWHKSYKADFQSPSRPFGFSDYPLVDGERLICTPCAPGANVVALDKRTGEVIWKSNVPNGTSTINSAIVPARFGDMPQYVVCLPSGLVGIAAADGKVLWQQPSQERHFYANTPLVKDGKIFSPLGVGPGIGLLEPVSNGSAWQVQQRYFERLHINGVNESSVLVNGNLYLFQSGDRLVCIDSTTGKPGWSALERSGRGLASLTCAENLLYLRYANGDMTLVEDDPKEYKPRGSFRIADHVDSAGTSTPVVAGQRLYLREENTLLCYDVRVDALSRARPEP